MAQRFVRMIPFDLVNQVLQIHNFVSNCRNNLFGSSFTYLAC